MTPSMASMNPSCVEVAGSQCAGTIAADERAQWTETIAYEVLTSVGKRVPRVYVEEFDG